MNLTDRRPTELERKGPGILDEHMKIYYLKVVQLLSCILFANAWSAACQSPLSFTISRSLLKLMSIESVMPSNHLNLCRPLLLLTFNLSQHQGLSQWVGSWHQAAKVLELQLKGALTHSLLFRESPMVIPGNEWMKENEWIPKETHDCLTPEKAHCPLGCRGFTWGTQMPLINVPEMPEPWNMFTLWLVCAQTYKEIQSAEPSEKLRLPRTFLSFTHWINIEHLLWACNMFLEIECWEKKKHSSFFHWD